MTCTAIDSTECGSSGMNPLGDILDVGAIALDLDAADRRAVLSRIAALLARGRGMKEADVYAALLAREQMGSTGLGHGVAIPHARMPQCVAPAAAFVRTKLAIPFDAPDARPVSVFLGLVVPQRANERHLQLLAAAATMFGDKPLRDKLKTCASPDALKYLVASWPDAAHSGDEAARS